MLKVIGAGPGRTGTLSLKTALETLGFQRCHHMADVLASAELADRWARVPGGEEPDWPTVFAGYQATVDWPSTARWRELIRAYPEAKVVLSVRDPERWYASMKETIFARAFPANEHSLRHRLGMRMFRLARPAHARLVDQLRRMQAEFFGTPPGRQPTKEEAVAAFERHREEVQRTVPADRLLTYEVMQGWEPLCDFLEVPVPDEPFPRVNDSANFRKNFSRASLADRSRQR